VKKLQLSIKHNLSVRGILEGEVSGLRNKKGAKVMREFEDWNQKVKKTFNATSNEEVLTVTEAGGALGLSKDQMKVYVDKHKLTKIPIMRSVHRYLLLKSEIEEILNRSRSLV
jgi:hypothetical protein